METENIHDYKPYGQQWRDDFTMKGIKYNANGLFPSGEDWKEQGKIVYRVICKSPYYIGKFMFSKHE